MAWPPAAQPLSTQQLVKSPLDTPNFPGRTRSCPLARAVRILSQYPRVLVVQRVVCVLSTHNGKYLSGPGAHFFTCPSRRERLSKPYASQRRPSLTQAKQVTGGPPMAVSGILIEEKLTKPSLGYLGLRVKKSIMAPWTAYPGGIWGPHRHTEPGY